MDGTFDDDNYPVRRGTAMKLDDFSALVWVHGTTTALNPRFKYFQGKRRIPAPLTIRRHARPTDLQRIAEEILGLSKMNWNTFDLYTKLPATVHSSIKSRGSDRFCKGLERRLTITGCSSEHHRGAFRYCGALRDRFYFYLHEQFARPSPVKAFFRTVADITPTIPRCLHRPLT